MIDIFIIMSAVGAPIFCFLLFMAYVLDTGEKNE